MSSILNEVIMKKVLFITKEENPYRTVFFNNLAEKVDLIVLCEIQSNPTRDSSWNMQLEINHKTKFLDGSKWKSIKMIRYVFANYRQFDEVIFGCVNSRWQMATYMLLKFLHKPFSLSLDGETFFNDTGMKLYAKKLFLKGASKYYIAGKRSTDSLCYKLGISHDKCVTYYFSSLTEKEIEKNRERGNKTVRDDFILTVGRFYDYKGLDIAVKVAAEMPERHFKFIGMGDRTEDFMKLCSEWKVTNIEAIPFLPKEALEKEYLCCKFFLLPSRKECWGLVVNEAASYGTPIVSTYGSGGAVEFLGGKYENLLAEPDDCDGLLSAINNFEKMTSQSIREYSDFLMVKAAGYSIERNVQCFVEGILG